MSKSLSPAFISYSRADSEFALRLAKDLKAAGSNVWLDQIDIPPGEPWDERIEGALIRAPRMIIILSPSSAKSQNVRDEISFALGQGKAVVPVVYADCVVPLRLQRQNRIDFRADYSRGLEALLDHLRADERDGKVQREAADDEIEWEPEQRAGASAAQHPERGNSNSQFNSALEPEQRQAADDASPRWSTYVERPADQALRAALDRGESIICIRCQHQSGKTLMLARGLDHARQTGKKVAVVDLQKFGERDLETFDRFCKALCGLIADRLGVDVTPESIWDEDSSPGPNLERYLKRHVLARFSGRLVLAIDEVDRLFTRDFSDEVFALFRSWHNERVVSPDSPLNRLTLVLLYTNARHLLIRNSSQSPFNVGVNIALEDFGEDEIAELAELREVSLNISGLRQFYDLFGGNPHLVSRGLDVLKTSQDLDDLVRIADSDEGPFADHLSHLLLVIEADNELEEATRELLQSGQIPDRERFLCLRSAGIVTGSGPHNAKFRSGIYRTYLARHLLGAAPHGGV